MFSFVNFKKMMFLSLVSLSFIHCGSSSAPAPDQASLGQNNLVPRKNIPTVSPLHATTPISSPANPESSIAPNSSVAPEANESSEADLEAFAADFISAVCEVAHACDSQIQVQECSRYLQNEGSEQIWDNLGVSVNNVQALLTGLETRTLTISETNLETCANQFANQCRSPNPNLMSGNYQNIENVIPDTFACSHVFVLSSSCVGAPASSSSTNATVDPSSASIFSSPASTSLPVPEISALNTSAGSYQ